MQQHLHAAKVVGRDVLLHPDDSADGPARFGNPMPHVQQQRPRPAGEVEVEHRIESWSWRSLGLGLFAEYGGRNSHRFAVLDDN